MPETLYNVTIPNTSPTITYTPYITNVSSDGWQSVCPTLVTSPSGQDSWVCDPDSAHTTSSNNAGFQLTFDGVAVYLFGNATNGVAYDITLDSAFFPGTPSPNSGLLYSAVGLVPGTHSVSLTVRQPTPGSDPGSVTFNEAVVSAGTGLTGGEFKMALLDDGDPSIMYYTPPGGNWTIQDTYYAQSIGPNGSTNFHNSYWADATATVKFQGIGIEVYGPCDSYSRYAAYTASIDGAAEISYGGTVNMDPDDSASTVKQRTSNCLRYAKTSLGGLVDHTLVLRVKDGGRLAVDWVRVYSVSSGTDPNGGEGGSSGSGGRNQSQSNSKIPTLVGAIAGGVVLAFVLLAIFICLRRRRRYDRQQDMPTPPTQVMAQTGPTPTPVPASPPPMTPTPIIPPWSQPQPQPQPPVPWSQPQPPAHWSQPQSPAPWLQSQSPAPSHAPSNNPSIGSAIPGVAMSIASSRAPLLSPGLSSISTYSDSGSGPGPALHRNSSSMSGPGAGSSPRPAELVRSTTVASRSSWVPRSSNVVVEGGLTAGSTTGGGYFADDRAGAVSPAPTAPPAYEPMQGLYAGAGTNELER